MNSRVIYFLGAGFSAPRGLPVMDNFLVKSKDLYSSGLRNREHFDDVFASIKDVAVISSYFKTDVFNIEEVLSILEMNAQLQGKALQDAFIKYIETVIESYTPAIRASRRQDDQTIWNAAFGDDRVWNQYGSFVAALLNLWIGPDEMVGQNVVRVRESPRPRARYDVISLNYDLILEQLCSFMCETYMGEPRFEREAFDGIPQGPSRPWLVKLHGSIDRHDIVPPTWSKRLDGAMDRQWKAAHVLLRQANEIRVLGYSLPVSDAFVRYLFKSSVVNSEHLKHIDVVTLDSDNRTEERYKEFVNFKYYRFANASIESYLQSVSQLSELVGRAGTNQTRAFDVLEDVHHQFMDRHRNRPHRS